MISNTDYLTACVDGDIAIVNQYLAQPESVPDFVDRSGNSAIMSAGNNTAIISAIVSAKPDINLNIHNIDGESALTLAIKNEFNEAVRLLLDLGADANTPEVDVDNHTPLAIAVIYKNQTAIEMLINKNADVNAIKSNDGKSILTLSLEEENFDIDITRLLILNGAKPSNGGILKQIFKNEPEIIRIVDVFESPTPEDHLRAVRGFFSSNEVDNKAKFDIASKSILQGLNLIEPNLLHAENPSDFLGQLFLKISTLSSVLVSNADNKELQELLEQTANNMMQISSGFGNNVAINITNNFNKKPKRRLELNQEITFQFDNKSTTNESSTKPLSKKSRINK